MRKIDRFSYNFFDFKIYTLEMDKSFFKYEDKEKEIDTSVEKFLIPDNLIDLKEIIGLIKYIPEKIEALKEPVLEKEVEEYSNSIKEKGTPYIKFTFLIRNDLDKLLKEEWRRYKLYEGGNLINGLLNFYHKK